MTLTSLNTFDSDDGYPSGDDDSSSNTTTSLAQICEHQQHDGADRSHHHTSSSAWDVTVSSATHSDTTMSNNTTFNSSHQSDVQKSRRKSKRLHVTIPMQFDDSDDVCSNPTKNSGSRRPPSVAVNFEDVSRENTQRPRRKSLMSAFSKSRWMSAVSGRTDQKMANDLCETESYGIDQPRSRWARWYFSWMTKHADERLLFLRFVTWPIPKFFLARHEVAYGLKITNRLMFRCFFSGVIGTILLTIAWFCVSVMRYTKIPPTVKSVHTLLSSASASDRFQSSDAMMVTFHVVCLVSVVLMIATPFVKRYSRAPEFAILWLFFTGSTLISVWSTGAVICEIIHHQCSPIDDSRSRLFLLFLTSVPIAMNTFFTVCVNAVLQLRSHLTWPAQLLCVVLSLILNGVLMFCPRFIDSYPAAVDRFTLAAVQCSFVIGTIFTSFVGRVLREYADRVLFLLFLLEKARAKKMQEDAKLRHTKRPNTAVEEIINQLQNVQSDLLAQLDTAAILSPQMTKLSIMTLANVVERLTKSENLYRAMPSAIDARDETTQQIVRAYALVDSKPMVKSSDAGRSGDESEVELHPKKFKVAMSLRSRARTRVGVDWNFDTLEYSRSHPDALGDIGAILLNPLIPDLNVDEGTVASFLKAVSAAYLPNPYHNKLHGATVAHHAMALVRMLDIEDSPMFDTIFEAAVVVACLGHDAGHPGVNNQFCVNSYHPLAQLYNDESVLENLHACLTFRMLERTQSNIFQSLPADVFKATRQKIIFLILATDMKHHFEEISRLRIRKGSPDFDYLQVNDDLGLVLKMCVKSADLSHATLPWGPHQEWSLRIAEEFYQQGDEERAMGLPSSPLFDRSAHGGFAKSQKGFIEFVVQPLYSELFELAGCRGSWNGDNPEVPAMSQIETNRQLWESMSLNGKAPPMPSSVTSLRSGHPTRFRTESAASMMINLEKMYSMTREGPRWSAFNFDESSSDVAGPTSATSENLRSGASREAGGFRGPLLIFGGRRSKKKTSRIV